MSSQMKGYCIVFKDHQGMPGIYTMFGKDTYNQILHNIQQAGEMLMGVFVGDQKSTIKVGQKAGSLVRNGSPSLEKKLKELGFTLPEAH